jgi:hypothetical protein
MNWVKSAALLLRYRQLAPSCLEDRVACSLLDAARHELQTQVRDRRVAQKFFNAVLLLLGLLRYRTVRPTFLTGNGDDPWPRESLQDIRRILREAKDIAIGGSKEIVAEVAKFLEGEGTGQLIYERIDAATEEDEETDEG